jgi:acyl-CoA reductase-like NAD-dependent aldehyde dehydrogenase
VYADRKIAGALEKRVVELVRELDPERDVGRLATEAQAAIVKRHVEGALAKGAEILAGGLPDGGDLRRFPATVVKVGDEDVELLTEETFGPVLPIVVVDGAEDATARVRASRFGLTTSIWTRSPERASHLVDAVGTPVVTFNCHGISAAIPEAPWTGVGESGFGVTNGPYALAELTRPRVVIEDTSSASTELYWYPYTPALRTLAVSLAMLRGGASFFGKIPAFFGFLGALARRLFEGGKRGRAGSDS